MSQDHFEEDESEELTHDEEISIFDKYFDDPYADLDEEYDDEDPEEHPLKSRASRLRQRSKGDG